MRSLLAQLLRQSLKLFPKTVYLLQASATRTSHKALESVALVVMRLCELFVAVYSNIAGLLQLELAVDVSLDASYKLAFRSFVDSNIAHKQYHRTTTRPCL